MTLVYLPGGRFRMGNFHDETARPIHTVEVSGFWMGQVHVTNAQFDLYWKRVRFPEAPLNNQPAMRVSRAAAMAFCVWLSKKEGRRYRLPTEAEWEYAARGGLDQKDYPWGDESVNGRACFNQMMTCPVGSFPPNAFKLYDMVGNAEQWVSDYYSDDYYANSPPLNPKGPPRPRVYVVRGGLSSSFGFKCSERRLTSFDGDPIGGFRVVMEGKSDAFDGRKKTKSAP